MSKQDKEIKIDLQEGGFDDNQKEISIITRENL
jgi:hypothetical protein